MLIDNRFGIILLGTLLGCATNINIIGAQSLLLSQMQPVYTLYLIVASQLLFSFFLKKFRLKKLKFSIFLIVSTIAYILILVSLSLPFLSGPLRNLLWFFLAMFGIRFFNWLVAEIMVRHLDPARAQSYFSLLVTSDEIGTLLAVIGLKTIGKGLDPLQTLYLSIFIFILSVLFIALQFVPKKNLEITFTKKKEAEPAIENHLLRTFILGFILCSIFLSIFRSTEDYLIKVVLKEDLVSFQAIKDMTANYMMIASLIIIPTSFVMGRVIQRKHVSPISLLIFHVLSMFALGTVLLFIQPLYFFIIFEIARRLEQNILYSTANQMVVGSFVGDLRNRLKAIHNFYYNTVVGIAVIFLFSYTQTWKPENQREFLIILILFSLLAAFFVILKLKGTLIKTLRCLVASGHKTATIVAVQSLSFLKPHDYETQMGSLLQLSPKKLLRKTIILGLSYSGTESSVGTIIKEFGSEKEEIQVAVLEALKIANNYRANQFILNILTEREKPKSLQVRINATAIIAAIYNKKAIPFLLNGLENSDPRVVANTLETLSMYKDKDLIPEFIKFSHSAIPRIRANALMGLARFKKSHKMYHKEISSVLKGNAPQMMASILYVIGKMKNTDFKEEILNLLNSPWKHHPLLQGTLAWALVRIYGTKYFDLVGELLGMPYREKQQVPFLHFFSQLSKVSRFDIIKHLSLKNHQDSIFIKNFGNHLRYSVFDFHEEIEFLHLIVDELKTKIAS